LYLAGNDRARDLAGDLAASGIKVETVVVYRATAAPHFADDIQGALAGGRIDGVLHFSRRSTAIFVDCARAGGLLQRIRALTHFCLSDRAAAPLRDAEAGDIRVAPQPDEAALIDLLPRFQT
jgi:uroporphyrinogen-III synthase